MPRPAPRVAPATTAIFPDSGPFFMRLLRADRYSMGATSSSDQRTRSLAACSLVGCGSASARSTTGVTIMPPPLTGLEEKFVELRGARLHYVETGRGPLVVLLHGFPEFWYSWRHQIPALAAAGFRVV